MPANSKLLPCPFCGDKAVAVGRYRDDGIVTPDTEVWVVCDGCHCGTNKKNDVNKAVMTWNTRAQPEAVHTFCHNDDCDKRDSYPAGPCPKCGYEQPEAVTNAVDVCKQVCDDNLLRFYISELKKTHTLVDDLVMTLKDCHPHISNDSIRARVGNMIIRAEKFKKVEE